MTDTIAPRSTLDITLSIVFALLGAGLAVVLGGLGVFLAFVSDACGSSVECDYNQLSTGILLAVLLPAVITVAFIVWMIVRLVRRKRAFWVPLVGAVAAGAGWGVGFFVATGAVPGFFS
jgi:uncharacterized BrkB/YihY/UPF0761 family membrane protein